jgi:predicted outer membrane protein
MYTNREEKNEGHIELSKKDALNISKEEARLLVQITELNLNISSLSKIAKKKSSNNTISSVATKLETDHGGIFTNLSQIASEKLVSIPDTIFNKNNDELLNLEGDIFNRIYLKYVTQLIEEEIKSFEQLSQRTLDTDFKILSLQAIVQLKTNLDEIKSNNESERFFI